LLSGVCLGQKTDSGNDLSDVLSKWDTQCSPKRCVLMTEVLRDDSGGPVPPDPKNPHEYIVIFVAVDRATRKPAEFAFHVDPNSQQDQGVFVEFIDTTREGNRWKANLLRSSQREAIHCSNWGWMSQHLPASPAKGEKCLLTSPFIGPDLPKANHLGITKSWQTLLLSIHPPFLP